MKLNTTQPSGTTATYFIPTNQTVHSLNALGWIPTYKYMEAITRIIRTMLCSSHDSYG